jgi:hypothetical protein
MQSRTRRIGGVFLALIALAILLIGLVFKLFVDEENAELHRVILRAKIIDDRRRKSASEYGVTFKYNGIYYNTALQADGRVFKLNDSVEIRIDSRNFLEYCEFAN